MLTWLRKAARPSDEAAAASMDERLWWSRSDGGCGVSVGEAEAEAAEDDEDWTPRGGRRRWYSSSSTVQTAPFTFSTRMKHLCRLRLWRTAF